MLKRCRNFRIESFAADKTDLRLFFGQNIGVPAALYCSMPRADLRPTAHAISLFVLAQEWRVWASPIVALIALKTRKTCWNLRFRATLYEGEGALLRGFT
jgi:hypothetical protein